MQQGNSNPFHEGTSGKKSPNEKTVSEILGEITWLMTQSPTHKQLFISELEWYCMPALIVRQFRMFYGPQSPAACVLWANVSEETETRLESGAHRLRPDEWNNGDRPWLIDVLAPFGAVDEILKDLSTNVFTGKNFKLHRINDQGVREVVTYNPTTGIGPSRH